MYYPTVSPHDSNRVMLRCDMTGTYITNDAGISWRMLNLRTTTAFFVYDPIDPETIYTYSLGLMRSTDGGKTWSLVYPHPDTLTGVKIAGDHGEESLVLSVPSLGSMSALAVDPADSHVLYAAINNWLYVSTDWGATWAGSHSLSGGATQIYVDPNSPPDDRTLYITGYSTVTVRERGEWRTGAAPAGGATVIGMSLGFPKGGGLPVAYATTPAGIYISDDGGASWRAATLPQGAKTVYSAIATSLFHPDVVYVSYSNLTEASGSYWFGVARSEDRGNTWNPAWKSGNKSPPTWPTPGCRGPSAPAGPATRAAWG
jgi:hypothetical protein